MSDVALITAVGAILGAIQGACTGWIHYQINRNACGGARCVETMTDALRIRVERTPGTVAVNEETHPITRGP